MMNGPTCGCDKSLSRGLVIRDNINVHLRNIPYVNEIVQGEVGR
jgi:hypothetical protein